MKFYHSSVKVNSNIILLCCEDDNAQANFSVCYSELFIPVGVKQKTNGMELECKQPVSCNCWWQIEAVDHASGCGNIMQNFIMSRLTI